MLRLYTDESPGLKVDPVVVLVLSLVFIFSVVALHSTDYRLVTVASLGAVLSLGVVNEWANLLHSYRQDHSPIRELDEETTKDNRRVS